MTRAMPTAWETHDLIYGKSAFRAAVVAAPEHFYARGPRYLTLSDPMTLEAAHAVADAVDMLFARCPAHQWGAAAQAAMAQGIEVVTE